MEAIWTVVCGKMVLAKDFPIETLNPTLETMRRMLRENSCIKTPDVPDFEMTLLCNEDLYDFWHGSNVVNLSEVKNYEYRELAQALVKACEHNYPVYLCLSRGPDEERENLTTFATFLLAYQPRIQRPLGATWSYAWENSSGTLTRITYGEICKTYETLKEAKILHL